jgi:V-type H+-transporting ATPase subunit C
MIKAFSDTDNQGWYGTKEELKDTEDFYPFILIKLGVPSTI